jgi:predicted PurR-regulated permease PerM
MNLRAFSPIICIISLATGIFIALYLVILWGDYPFLGGQLALLLNYVPNIGSIIADIPAVLHVWIQ